jgi:tetratricopeptide (TPR) repeat protein
MVERPNKKSRPTTVSEDMVIALADRGIADFYRARFDDSERRFSEALCFSKFESFNSAQVSFTSDSVSVPSPTKENQGTFDESQASTSCDGKQKQEYDEGMAVYVDVLRVHDLQQKEAITATLLYNVGQVNASRGRFKAAMTYFKRSLTICEQSPSQESTISLSTVKVLCNLGYYSYRLQANTEAQQYYRQALSFIQDFSLGKFVLAGCLNSLGIMLFHSRSDDCLEGAHAMLQQSLALYQSECGGTAMRTSEATVLNNIGRILYLRGEHSKAIQSYKTALEIRRASLGNTSIDTAATVFNLAQCYRSNPDTMNESMKCYVEFVQIVSSLPCRDILPDLAHGLRGIAEIHYERSEMKLALGFYEQAHHIQVKTHGPDSLQAAEMLSNIGLVQYQTGCYDAAFQSYQEALRIRRDSLGTDTHPDISSTLNSIGLVLFKRQEHAMSERCFAESLRIRRTLLGPNHREVAILWYNLATVQFELGEADIAIASYKEALRVEREALGADHPDVILTVQHLGQVYQQLGHLNEALQCFQEGLVIEKKNHSGDTMFAGKLLNQIGNVYLQQGNTAAMMTSFAEALQIYQGLKRPWSSLLIAGYIFYGLSKQHPPCAQVA